MREMNSITLNGKKYDIFVDDKAREMIGRRSNLTAVSEIIGVARSYHKARYQADGVTPTFFYNTANTPLTGEYDPDSEEFKGAIDCSTYVGLCLRGIPFEKSPYAHLLPGAQTGDDDAADADTGADNNNGDDNATDTDASGAGAKFDPASLVANVADFSWAINPFEWKLPQVFGGDPKPVRTAAQLAQWMYERGMAVPLDETFSNLMPGDIVFWAKKKSNGDWVQPNRYKHISHVAICCGRYDAPKDDPDWKNWPAKYPYRHTTLEVTTISPYVLNRTLEVRSPGSVVMICRPDLGSLSSGDYKGNLSTNFGITDISEWYRPGLYYLTSDVVGGLPDGVESGKYCTLRVEVSRSRQGSVRTITHTLINAKTNVATYINTQYCYNRLPGKDNWTGWRSEGSSSGSNSSQNVDLTGYATKQYVQNYAQPKGEYLTEETDPTVPSWAKQPNKPSYTAAEVGARPNTWMPTAKEVGALPSSYVPPDQTPEQVGADPAGAAEHTVGVHDASTTAHNDIRLLIEGLSNDKLDADKLPAAINTALAQAQVSGEFDGKTPVKGTDYFTEADTTEMVEDVRTAFAADISWLDGYDIPKLYLTGDTTGMSKDVAVTLNWEYGENSGSCTLKWQGSSSLAYDKKNYTIKLDTAIEAVEGWGSQKKYCLKANYIDHTHARNIVSARLWGQIVASRSPKNTTLASCPNYGAVDGFPIAIVLNGEFHGLYTWNIPKDFWTYNMGSGTQEAVICSDEYVPATDFRVPAVIDGSDFELEEVTDENNSGWVATSFNRLVDALNNSYGSDLDTTIAQYMDWQSAIDYYIYNVIEDGRDACQKNCLLTTYDGTKWIWNAYDRDSNYGLPSLVQPEMYPANAGVSFDFFRRNRVMELIYRFKTNELKNRYKELRDSVLSEDNICVMFETFMCGIPSRLLNEDVKKWPSIPRTSANTVDQILRWLHRRLGVVDKWVEELPAQETPVAPANRTGNAVPISIDKTGAVYNGNGYKDGYTINISNGVESETAEDGCCITGFIPVTQNTIVKVTTDNWNVSPKNSRIIFYDASFVPMAFYTQDGYVSLFNGYTNATAIQDKSKQSVSYDTNGMTTLNIAYGTNCTDLAYIRIRAVGKGANLAVIREGEAPETPEIPDVSGYTNLIPTSIDTNGSVFNGTGYLVGSRLNSSGSVVAATTYATSTLVTGFIPFEIGDIIRTYQLRERLYMPGSDTYVQSNGYVSFFDKNFVKLDQFNGGGYSGGELIDADNSSWDYDESTKITTVNIAWKSGATGVAYFRMSGVFNLVDGENNDPVDSVITVNEEIT